MAFDLEQLADFGLFARVVEARSFSEAARRSKIAKSAVSRRIALLERRLGVQLLRRTTRKLHVTPDGFRFYEHCVQMLASARAARDAISGAEVTLRGGVRISAPVTFSQLYLARAIAEFQIESPELEVQLTADDRLVDVVDSDFDLVVRISRLTNASFVARRLATDRLVVTGAPNYFERQGRPFVAEDLVHHNCLHYELVPQAAEWRFRGADRKPLVAVKGNFSANDGSVLRRAAIFGLGLAVLPFHMIASDVASGRLELVLETQRKAEIGIYAVFSSTRGLPLRVRALLDHLTRWFAKADWNTLSELGARRGLGVPIEAERLIRRKRSVTRP